MHKTFIIAAFIPLLLACPNRSRLSHSQAPDGLHENTIAIDVERENLEPIVLGARLLSEGSSTKKTGVLFIPGGGRVSRSGTRSSDGTRTYGAPVNVTESWQNAFAEAGFLTLAYDKRTCSEKDDERCVRQDTSDLDKLGPVALTTDVDAACEVLRNHDESNGQIILVAQGQGTTVALASQCAKSAEALLLVAAIPRRIDHVMVGSLKTREAIVRRRAKKESNHRSTLLAEAGKLKNAAASLEATFASIDNNRFAEGARVKGATLAFWKGWISFTDRAPELVRALNAKKIFVLGQWDLQFSKADKTRIKKLAEGELFIEVEQADHHLLQKDAVSPELLERLIGTLRPPQS